LDLGVDVLAPGARACAGVVGRGGNA
jgi:hypothetical protein